MQTIAVIPGDGVGPEVIDEALRVLQRVSEIDGLQFYTFDGGEHFKFTEGISLLVNAPTQDEIDYYWEKLTSGGGEESMCGWLKDKFGISWQIIPPMLMQNLIDPDKEKSNRVFEVMLKMKKIIIADLEAAAKG